MMALPAPVVDPAFAREPPPRPDQTGRIAGRVTAAGSGKPAAAPLTPKVSHVTGSILDDRGKARSDYAVVVFSADSSHWGDRSRFVAMGRPSQQGGFDIKGLPSEEYLAVALADVSMTEYFDPEFLETLRPIATSFSLGDGESKVIALSIKKRR